MEADSQTYFYKLKPHPTLTHLIKFYWVLKVPAERPPCPEWMLPDPFAEIIFNRIQAPYQRQSKGADPDCIQDSYAVVSNGKPVQAAKMGAIDMVGVKLLPYALQAISGARSDELTQPVVLSDLKSPVLNHLAEQLKHQISDTELKVLLDHAMGLLLEQVPVPRVFEAMDLQVKKGGLLRIDELSKLTGQNISTLEKGFKRYVGMTPKAFQKMVRFRNYYHCQLQPAQPEEKPHFYDFGYYDQNHLIKDYKFFTGRTPGQHLLVSPKQSFEITNQHFGRQYWAF